MKKFLFAAPLFLALAACGQPVAYDQAPVVPVAGAPVVVAQPSHDGFLTGLMAGHILSGGFGGYGGHSSHTTINKTVNVNKTVVAPSAPSRSSIWGSSSSSASRSSAFSAPARSSWSSGSSYSRSSFGSSSFSRSSFSSGRSSFGGRR